MHGAVKDVSLKNMPRIIVGLDTEDDEAAHPTLSLTIIADGARSAIDNIIKDLGQMSTYYKWAYSPFRFKKPMWQIQ